MGNAFTYMKTVVLKKIDHSVKIGDSCGDIEPNITEDTLFVDEDGEPVGFYMRNITGKLRTFATIANEELLSERVPKSMMKRSS